MMFIFGVGILVVDQWSIRNWPRSPQALKMDESFIVGSW